MIVLVTVPTVNGTEEMEFRDSYCDIIDGALVFFRGVPGSQKLDPYTGFAPGAWITFEVVPDAD